MNSADRPRQPVAMAALVASLVVHAVAVVLVGWLPEPEAPPTDRTIEATEVTLLDAATLESLRGPRVDPEPAPRIEPEIEPDPDSSEEAAPTPTSQSGPSEPTRTPQTPPAPVAAEPTTPAAPTASGSLLTMRGNSAAPASGPVPRPSSLRPPPIAGSNAAPRAPEGPERPPPPPAPEPRAGSDRKPRSLAEAGFEKRKDGTYRYRTREDPFKAVLHPNGRIEFKFKGTAVHRVGIDDAMRAGSGEELFAAAKKRLLRDTFELRMNMATRWAEAQMQTQLKQLTAQLHRTWKQSGVAAPKKRKEIFFLWDDCEEQLDVDAKGVEASIEARLDEARQSAGGKARKKIIDFIATNLPKGSADAYTVEELKSFNAKRHSKQKFDPYKSSAAG